MVIDPELLEIVTSLAAVLFFGVLAYLRSKYAAVGDKFLAEMGKLLAVAKAAEEAYPDIAPLVEKLEIAYDTAQKLWVGGEFSGWVGLMAAIKDFYAVYLEIQKIISNATPKK